LEEALGLLATVVKEAFATFEAKGWIALAGHTLTLRDTDALHRLADFDPRYLHLERPSGPAGRPIDWVKPL
jgi:hypothetical protein